jgi:hypothetical protein
VAKRERYVYYRIVPAQAAGLQGLILERQEVLRQAYPGLAARLLKRSDQRGETWMEIYAMPSRDEGVDDALLAEIEAAMQPLLVPSLIGERHVETFEPCVS